MRPIAVVRSVWRAGVRISEALAVNETDLDPDRGSLVARHEKGDRRRDVGMGPVGMDAARTVAQAPQRATGRPTVPHHARPNTRATARLGRDLAGTLQAC